LKPQGSRNNTQEVTVGGKKGKWDLTVRYHCLHHHYHHHHHHYHHHRIVISEIY